MRHPFDALSIDNLDYLLRVSFAVTMKNIEIALGERYLAPLVY
jgi:hypothetical protein